MPLSSPHLHGPVSTALVMRRVIYALLPGIAACWWFFGWGVVVTAAVASAAALGAEAAVLAVRGRPILPALADGSALLTALLFAAAVPPLLPWWATVLGIAFAIVFAKQLYGGLGYNPFNPAMVAYVVLLISFPLEMSSWLPPAAGPGHHLLDLPATAAAIFTGHLPGGATVDAVTSASPLDILKVQVGLNKTIEEVFASPLHGIFGGRGWEWIDLCYFLGGVWLILRRVITWHIPATMLGTLFFLSLACFLLAPDRYPPPTFHLFSGAAMLGAFFIATDPVTAGTTERGRLLFGAGIGALTFVIRTWGGFPDGVAFAVLLMNVAAPTIDYYTRPRVFGERGGNGT